MTSLRIETLTLTSPQHEWRETARVAAQAMSKKSGWAYLFGTDQWRLLWSFFLCYYWFRIATGKMNSYVLKDTENGNILATASIINPVPLKKGEMSKVLHFFHSINFPLF